MFILFTENSTNIQNSIIVPPTEDGENIVIPLSLKGITLYFPIRKPTLTEYDIVVKEGRSYDLTYDNPERDLYV